MWLVAGRCLGFREPKSELNLASKDMGYTTRKSLQSSSRSQRRRLGFEVIPKKNSTWLLEGVPPSSRNLMQILLLLSVLLRAGRFFGVGLLSWGLSSHTLILKNCGVGPPDSPEDSARVPPATFISEHMVKVSEKKRDNIVFLEQGSNQYTTATKESYSHHLLGLLTLRPVSVLPDSASLHLALKTMEKGTSQGVPHGGVLLGPVLMGGSKEAQFALPAFSRQALSPMHTELANSLQRDTEGGSNLGGICFLDSILLQIATFWGRYFFRFWLPLKGGPHNCTSL